MRRVILTLLSSVATLILTFCVYYNIMLEPVSNESVVVKFEIKDGDTLASLGNRLEEAGLIKSNFFYKLYIRFNSSSGIKTGYYSLDKNMDVREIVDILSGKDESSNGIKITFKEEKNMRYIAKTIAENTNNTEEDVYTLVDDKQYINTLIDKYWFLSDIIENDDIYYSLEGYLYPSTYEFEDKDVSVQDIFTAMLNKTDAVLTPLKSEIEVSGYSVHQILTLASIIELEGVKDDDRAMISGVFYNRLKAGWSLGSDVTTYYAAKVDLSERDLYKNELNAVNPYNTRSDSMKGKLPIGPICNPSISSIKAALNPTQNDYYYFVSDVNGTTYFTKTEEEHQIKKQQLIDEGIWYVY